MITVLQRGLQRHAGESPTATSAAPMSTVRGVGNGEGSAHGRKERS